MKRVKDKVALVTGGASGIGRAIVELFIQEGAKVVFTDLNETLGKQVEGELGEQAYFIKADASSPEDNQKIVKEAVQKFGALHIAVNNAGIGGEANAVGDMSIEGWKKVIDINLNGVFYGMHYQLPEIEKVGGSIINMASILGYVGFASSSAYSAAKHGVLGLTKSAAWEYGTRNVRINAVGPGFIATPLVDNAISVEAQNYLKSQHTMQRLGTSQEVASLVLWLASDESSFATGAYYPIDGGYLAK
ncbi:SDR family NAD(P)-dependent oxidoreductase [Elizabethkingia sp. JS20170427COW]|uniref:SDR family NAD(P)-dependent oxidoreductase n=1 Tax=Elizabethkingia sp. JS20170427COW TaxID=2583851 RepID=UPI0011102460|nr:SDR family oxidoreductase [Elizabethkingia sp. JS20170427COW]QCX54101.1 SDR family oxidoreductase [Elizabethkingia sp. JS20170427COW]